MSGAQDLISVARSELGTSEAPPRSNRVKYSSWYGLVGPWCAMFVTWCADRSGNLDVIPRHAYTPAGAAWYQDRRQFDRVPRVGSLAFYDVSGLGRISHVGIVESVTTHGAWYAIEGNSSAGGSRTGGQVCRVRRSALGKLGGFGHPAYADGPAPVGTAEPYPGLLRRGSQVGAVRAVQRALNRSLGIHLAIDGQFGPATERAVVAFQLAHGLAADGLVGRHTWAELAP